MIQKGWFVMVSRDGPYDSFYYGPYDCKEDARDSVKNIPIMDNRCFPPYIHKSQYVLDDGTCYVIPHNLPTALKV